MYLRKNKKAMVEIDWIISFSIFITYLFWFFIFAVPTYQPRFDSTHPLLDSIENKLTSNTTWSVEQIPLIVYSNITATSEPVIADFNLDWLAENLLLENNLTRIDGNKLILIADIGNSTNEFWLYHSNETYVSDEQIISLDTATEYASVPDAMFKVFFENSLPITMEYKNSTKILNTTYYINGNADENMNTNANALNISGTDYNASSVAVRYIAIAQATNISSYVFARNSRIYTYFAPDALSQFSSSNLTISLNFQGYTKFYSDELFVGNTTLDIENDADACTNYSADYITLFNDDDALSIITTNSSMLWLCNKNLTFYLNITVGLLNTTSIRFIFHEGNYSAKSQYYDSFSTGFGAIEKTKGSSEALITAISNISYTGLKQDWGVPYSKDFSIVITNSTNTLLEYHAAENITKNVYGKQFNDVMIDKFGNSQRITASIAVW